MVEQGPPVGAMQHPSLGSRVVLWLATSILEGLGSGHGTRARRQELVISSYLDSSRIAKAWIRNTAVVPQATVRVCTGECRHQRGRSESVVRWRASDVLGARSARAPIGQGHSVSRLHPPCCGAPLARGQVQARELGAQPIRLPIHLSQAASRDPLPPAAPSNHTEQPRGAH